MKKHLLKLTVALLATLVFFVIWDRADVTDYRVGSYNSSGLSYEGKGDYVRAIDDFSEAIRLYSGSATLFNNRGNAYKGKGDLDHAISDYNEAIRLSPNSGNGYHYRGNAYEAKGDFERALDDFNAVIRLHPEYVLGYLERGRINLYCSLLDNAQSDFEHAISLDPTSAYAALWLELARRRNNLSSNLAKATEQLDMTQWPAPVLRLFVGEATPTAVLAAANDANPATQRGQVCEANFFIAEWNLLQGATEDATRLFRLAISDCPRNYIEWNAGNAELSRLGSQTSLAHPSICSVGQ
jgi:lipoprotein NlpI